MKKINLKDEDLIFAIKKCAEFLENNDWSNVSLGRHDIKDTEIYAMVSEYNTRFFEESNWEAHKKYADLQVILEGKENILVSDISSMKTGEYHSDSDYLECDGDVEETVCMDSTIGLLLMPEDVHMPGVCVNKEPSYVKKCVFKIPIGFLK